MLIIKDASPKKWLKKKRHVLENIHSVVVLLANLQRQALNLLVDLDAKKVSTKPDTKLSLKHNKCPKNPATVFNLSTHCLIYQLIVLPLFD